MENKLSSIGMEKGKQYETVITTRNENGSINAAPIGVICAGEDIILNRIFKGSKTLDNILKNREFTVNITHNPVLFTYSTIGNLDESHFAEDTSIKSADAYFKCEVISFKEAVKQSDPIRKSGAAIVIKSRVTELTIKNNINAFNRSFAYVIESLSNFTRFDLVDDAQKEYYLDIFREANRIVNKVGYKEEKQAMDEIKKELVRKGYDI